ncbi:MAG TPA: pitrilysin family protein [Kofleriaceae bacterium]|jgi:zinc protease|nr:pitrilysin family protein [Kofleriaceae bacterium]
MRGILSFLVVAGLSIPAAAQAPAPAAPKAPAGKTAPAKAASTGVTKQLPPIERFTLKNGLEVAFMNVDVPVAAVQVWYHAGSKDEPRDRRGSAHMFEHMMFKGTQHVRPEAHAQMLNGIGGYVNAATDEDATHYINNVPPDYVDFAIQLEAERMRNLLFRKDMIDTEKEVVKEEIRQQENSPITKGFLRFLQIAFTKHPYSWTAGGNLKDLDATTPQDLKKFYDAYYQPNNAMLVVAGKGTLEQVKASAEKWFGSIPKAADPPRPAKDAQEPAQTAQRRETTEPSQIGITAIGWHIPGAKDKDVYAIQVASIILGAGESSRLKVRLKATDPKTKQALALDGGVQPLVHEDPGIVIALAAYLDKTKVDPVEKVILEEVKKLGDSGPTADELRKAKNQVQSGFIFGLEDATGLAEAIGRSWIQTGDPSSFVRDVDEIENVKADDVKRVVKTYFAPEKATIVVIPPAR